MNIPEIVKNHVLQNCGRMPETQEEIDQYLDLINHSKEYAKALELKRLMGLKMMGKLGFKTPSEVKAEFKKDFVLKIKTQTNEQ